MTVIKSQEMTDPRSCMSKALPFEMTFVLLGRDEAAPDVIRTWVNERIRRGLNQPGDPQIIEAEQCASRMEKERGFIKQQLGK
jgi:uncharacterized caspase-like protein